MVRRGVAAVKDRDHDEKRSPEQDLSPVTGDMPVRSPTSYAASDLDLLARLVQAEAEGQPYEGQVAVAATVLNRIKDPRYPNTIQGVIYQVVGRHYQYSTVANGRINLPAGETAYQAAIDAINGSDPSKGANGFYNPAKTRNRWVRSQPVTVVIGDHWFFQA